LRQFLLPEQADGQDDKKVHGNKLRMIRM